MASNGINKATDKCGYAIVDIETTGGSVSNSRITEIAILLHDGKRVTARWSSLVHPEMDIPLHITALTGIDDDMVAKAPVFSALAQEVYERLKDRVFVAHNVNFDYSFLRGQLAACGLIWEATKLCTVRLSRKLIPGMASYSLGKLCAQLGISLKNRHRAMGDALATATLFSLLLDKDEKGMINAMLRKTSAEQRLPPNVPMADFLALPDEPGIYYFHDQKGKVIYVGKAVNLKKRVASHFTGNSETLRRQHFLRDIYGISFERCGSELMALLLECIEIQRLWPVHNQALKRFEPKYGLYHYTAVSGYGHLAVGKVMAQQQCLKTFNREAEAVNFLVESAKTSGIDPRFCRYGRTEAFRSTLPLPDKEQHNLSINKMLMEIIDDHKQSFVLMLKGREEGEVGYVWIENGEFYAMGYLEGSFTEPHEVKDALKRYKGNHYMNQLITGFAQQHPAKVIWLH